MAAILKGFQLFRPLMYSTEILHPKNPSEKIHTYKPTNICFHHPKIKGYRSKDCTRVEENIGFYQTSEDEVTRIQTKRELKALMAFRLVQVKALKC